MILKATWTGKGPIAEVPIEQRRRQLQHLGDSRVQTFEPMHVRILEGLTQEMHEKHNAVSCLFETHQKFVSRFLSASGRNGLFIAPANTEK